MNREFKMAVARSCNSNDMEFIVGGIYDLEFLHSVTTRNKSIDGVIKVEARSLRKGFVIVGVPEIEIDRSNKELKKLKYISELGIINKEYYDYIYVPENKLNDINNVIFESYKEKCEKNSRGLLNKPNGRFK